ncbi:hypothetical protein HY086_02625 [Candidatus Gottesmanbacteria bacterium]|nr:hypothetical protein [Candidatus Gottesmanbacteria bacterium]
MKLGKAFSDNVVIERSGRRILPDESPSWWHGAGRALLFSSVVVVAFFALVLRLVHLTIVRGHQLRSLADGNRTRELIRHAPRGILFDRTGKSLTSNVPQDRVVSPEGPFVEVDYRRDYPYTSALAHVVGYTGELSEKELAKEYFAIRQYRAGDRIGKTGAEEVFEETLRGRNGKELVEVDAQGKILRTLGRDPEVAGEPVTLSVDAELAKIAEQSFPVGAKGAIVVAKPSTGELLALYSSPSFDPNKFARGLTQTEYESLLNDPDKPLFFRAIGGVYPPGSTFKIVNAIAGLEEGAINKSTMVEDNGSITIGPFTFPNWYFTQYGKTEGPVTIVKAIQRSNDIFFYKAGEWLGITKLAAWAKKIGIGKPLGIELGGEAGGLMPDPAWKNERFTSPADLEARNNLWYLGDTYHVAIGQGYLLVTPLQLNTWTNAIANGGKLCKPTIKKVTSDTRPASPAGRHVTSECKDLGIKKETIQLITEGMRKACEPGGTGWPLFEFKIQNSKFKMGDLNEPSTLRVPVACKTGTAEFGDPNNKTHAWFTVFAPVDEPEISVSVLVEGGGEGSNVAAPIAKKILESWFSR